MKAKIQEIIDQVSNTGLIERWGGWCFNKTDKDLPYGVSITNTTKGTLYGYDDNFYSTSYLFVKELKETGIRNQVRVTVGIYVFTPRLKWGEDMNTYDLALNLYAQLTKKYKETRFSSVISDKYVPNEVALIEIDFYAYGQCELPEPVWWDFEGTMTVGEFEAEGDVMEYGYRAGWGDDYGTLSDFFTQYEYAGIYWIDGVLYAWGVNATVIKIGSTTLNNGTYNEAGYTSFVIAENPFPESGEEVEIKVKGDVTEIWDYEGVMTVGFQAPTIYGYGDGSPYFVPKVGNITPELKYSVGRNYYVVFQNGSIIKVSEECNYLYINGVCYIPTNFSNGESYLINGTNPFPAVGETCTIKIKL